MRGAAGGPVQAILFDMMGVLLHRRDDYVPELLVDAIDDRIGSVTDDGRFREEIRRDFQLTDQLFQVVLARVPTKYEAFGPLWELLPGLRKRFKIAVVNNGTSLTLPWFDARFGIARSFDLYLASGQAGAAKPEAGIYELACRKLGVAPGECLFMDDSEKNVTGAQRLGMQTIHWPDPAAGLRRFQDWLDGEAE